MTSWKGQGFKAKRDATEPEIVKALQSCGCLVQRSDVVDLIVQHRGWVFLVECKTPKNKAGRFEATENQQKMIDAGWHLTFITSASEAVEFANGIRARAA